MRPVDADELVMFPYSERSGTEDQIAEWIEQAGLSGDDTASRARNLCWKVIEGFINVVKTQPTLTPPNEWVSAKDNPPQLTGKYICCIEDTHGHMWSIPADYLLEMKTWVGEFGEIKNKVVYWMPIPAPHDRRPPEGEA